METNAERRTRKLIELAAKTEGGLRSIADASGLSYDSLDQVVKGVLLPPKRDGSRSPRKLGDSSAERIQEALGLPRDWFDSPDKLPVPSFETDHLPAARIDLQEAVVVIPLLANSGSMGPGIDDSHEDVVVGTLTLSPVWITSRIKPLTTTRNLRFIHGYGDSMEPTFSDGDVMLVDTGIASIDVDGVYVLEAGSRIYIKRVRRTINGELQVSSDNVTVKTVDVLDGKTTVHVKGKVVWVWNGKKI